MLLNVVLTPGLPPRSQSSDMGPSASCGYCCPLCPTGEGRGWGSVFGEHSFYRVPGDNWAQETCTGCPSSGTPWERVRCTKGAKSTGTGAPLNFYRCSANSYRSTAKFYRSTANFTGPPLFFIDEPLNF